MTLGEFDSVLASVVRSLRLECAAAAVWKPVAALLAVLGAAVLCFKLLPVANPRLAVDLAVFSVALAIWCVFLAAYLARPVSALRAAAEVDRLAGLKERAASLVAARTGAAPRSAAFVGLESDATAALAPLSAKAVRRALVGRHMERLRWLLVLLAFVAGTLLLPARRRQVGPELAALLVEGAELVAAAESVGAAGPGLESRPQAEAARKFLVILRGEPPADVEAAAKQKGDLQSLAAELRKDGTAAGAELAARAEELARLLGEMAGRRSGDALPAAGGQTTGEEAARVGAARSYPEYSELLARYYGDDGR